jgi:hypothetical protein
VKERSNCSLLDWAESRSRISDPETSQVAEQTLAPKLNQRCQQFLGAIRKLGRATANEVAQQVAPDNPGLFGSIRRRASDLHKIGVIRVSDRRRCTVTGQYVSEYEVVS